MSVRLPLVVVSAAFTLACSPAESTDTGATDGTETSGGTDTDGGPLACTDAAPDALRVCVAEVSAAITSCYASSGAPCADDDAAITGALDTLQSTIEERCDADAFGLDTAAAVGRLRNACTSEAGSIAWRTFGGPQGAVWPMANGDDQACLQGAHEAVATLVDDSLLAINGCLEAGDCDAATIDQQRATLAATAQSDIEALCTDLSGLIAVDPATYVARADRQVDCLTSAGHMDPSPLSPKCGPSHAAFDAPRGEWTQVTVDGDEWGTLCGDGSPYAFQIRLAPEGEPLDRVVVGLQGGGVCLFADDCESKMGSNPGLFNALDDEALGLGIASDDPNENPFANWTKVYLPYCNQDVFAGGGVEEDLGSLVLPRYGAVNMRSAMQMVRDVLWRELDAAGGPGFRPDEIIALFGGWSAGGYGTLYNYHWFLDDLLWPRTSAFPDAGLGLDTGEALGVAALGDIKIPVWGTTPNLPPYCFEGQCAVGEVLFNAISPRLERVPEQQMLMLTNPFDLTQQSDAFFSDTPSFINALRQSYCATKDLPGIHYYYTSESTQSIHVVSVRPEMWAGEVDGESMRDWFWRAVTEPETLVSRVEEADFVTAFPGVEPYPCEVAP